MNDNDINHILWTKDNFELMLFYNKFNNREEIHIYKKII